MTLQGIAHGVVSASCQTMLTWGLYGCFQPNDVLLKQLMYSWKHSTIALTNSEKMTCFNIGNYSITGNVHPKQRYSVAILEIC